MHNDKTSSDMKSCPMGLAVSLEVVFSSTEKQSTLRLSGAHIDSPFVVYEVRPAKLKERDIIALSRDLLHVYESGFLLPKAAEAQECLQRMEDLYDHIKGSDHILVTQKDGKMEHEVSLVSKAIEYGNYDTKVASFSTNVETTNAYAYLPDSVAGRNTGQKILNGNIHEMLLRALVDIHQGSRYVIVKPAENTYLISELSRLLGDSSHLENFLNDENVVGTARGSVATGRVIHEIRDDIAAFAKKARDVQLGTYTVSGTYFSDTQLLARKGPGFTWDVLEERFANILASGYAHPGRVNLIDRNAAWFAGQTGYQGGVH